MKLQVPRNKIKPYLLSDKYVKSRARDGHLKMRTDC